MILFKKLNKNIKYIIDVLFPPRCFGCGKHDTWLCNACTKTVSDHYPSECPFCHVPSINYQTCADCSKVYKLSCLWVIGEYDKAWKYIIHKIKFSFIESAIADIITRYEGRIEKLINKDCSSITAVPLSVRRRKLRGFNQAEIIARIIAKNHHLKYIDLLERTSDVQEQSHLSKAARLKNVGNNIFQIKKIEKYPESVIIIDDVFTTGATMEACARTLSDKGIAKIYGLAIARGKWRKDLERYPRG